MTSEVFVQILKDLDIYASSQNIKRPLILFMDGASPHISLSMAKFCRDTEIQPWLFKPKLFSRQSLLRCSLKKGPLNTKRGGAGPIQQLLE